MSEQCDESIGQCWCVDQGTGTEQMGTRRNGFANCNGKCNVSALTIVTETSNTFGHRLL